MHRPNGETSHSFRPDTPDKPGRKYEQPSKRYGGPGNVLYVHPSQRHLITDTSVPVIYVEGIKKALSIITAARVAGVEVLVVAISGVWNFLSEGKPITDLPEIPVEGREVGIVFDSDVLTNPGVQGAAMRLAETEIGRGASVRLAYLPDAPNGAKVGADDFLVSGKTYAELRMTMRAYDPGDLETIKLSRDDELRAAFEDLERRHSDTIWSWRGAEADSNLYQALAALGRKHGKIHQDGIRVVASWGELALEAKIGSPRTVGKSIARMEERGLLYRDTAGRKEGKPGAFVLCADVKHVGKTGAETKSLEGRHPCTLHPRSPRLWASRPKFKPTKAQIRKHRLGTLSHLPEPREGLKRLGKKRSHALDRFDAAGGVLALDELAKLMGVRRRDLTRRKTKPDGRDGLLIWLIDAGIVRIDGETASLTPDWLDRLEDQRKSGEEIEAGERAKNDRKRRNLAYRDYLRGNRDKAPESRPSAAGLEAVRRSRAMRDARLRELARAEEERRKAGPPPELEAMISRMLGQLGRMRMGLLVELAMEEGFDRRDVPEAVRAMGYRVERLSDYGGEEFLFSPAEGAA